MPVVNAISFLTANSVTNPSQATKSRVQTTASTPQTVRTVLQQQATASSTPLPLDSTPAGCLGHLSPQPVSQAVCQEAQGWARIRIHVTTACMLLCLEGYWEADMEEAQVMGRDVVSVL